MSKMIHDKKVIESFMLVPPSVNVASILVMMFQALNVFFFLNIPVNYQCDLSYQLKCFEGT
jgi:hypothetical protein